MSFSKKQIILSLISAGAILLVVSVLGVVWGLSEVSSSSLETSTTEQPEITPYEPVIQDVVTLARLRSTLRTLSRKRIAIAVVVSIAILLLIAGGVVGIILYRRKMDEEASALMRAQEEERIALEKSKQLQLEKENLQSLETDEQAGQMWTRTFWRLGSVAFAIILALIMGALSYRYPNYDFQIIVAFLALLVIEGILLCVFFGFWSGLLSVVCMLLSFIGTVLISDFFIGSLWTRTIKGRILPGVVLLVLPFLIITLTHLFWW
jgi:hypothetical protein